MDESIEDRVAKRRVHDQVVPVLNRDLAGNECRAPAAAILDPDRRSRGHARNSTRDSDSSADCHASGRQDYSYRDDWSAGRYAKLEYTEIECTIRPTLGRTKAVARWKESTGGT
jgi:hypothetical protein